jgi:hypothetical protein
LDKLAENVAVGSSTGVGEANDQHIEEQASSPESAQYRKEQQKLALHAMEAERESRIKFYDDAQKVHGWRVEFGVSLTPYAGK